MARRLLEGEKDGRGGVFIRKSFPYSEKDWVNCWNQDVYQNFLVESGIPTENTACVLVGLLIRRSTALGPSVRVPRDNLWYRKVVVRVDVSFSLEKENRSDVRHTFLSNHLATTCREDSSRDDSETRAEKPTQAKDTIRITRSHRQLRNRTGIIHFFSRRLGRRFLQVHMSHHPQHTYCATNWPSR